MIVGGHAVVLVALLLSDRHVRLVEREALDALEVVLVRAPERVPDAEPPASVVNGTERRSSRARPDRTRPERAPDTRSDVSSAITVPRARIDWERSAERAAAAATAAPRRGFALPESTAKAAPPPEFGWDRTHTERIHAIEGGGIGIRLSDNCEIVLMPLPFGGCALGKRKARGDLFDGMKAPERPASSVPDVPR